MVDQALCMGCKTCVHAFPETFEAPWHESSVKEGQTVTQEMVDICPVGAISLSK